MNKVKFGLSNVYYAVVTVLNGIVTYGTPVAIPGAVNLTQSAAGDPIRFDADNGEYYSENINNGYDGTLEMALIPDSFRTSVLGDTIDANGALIENKDGVANKIALMYEFDGDVNKTRHVNYNVKVSRPNIDSSTHTTTKDVKTDSMNIEVRPSVDSGDVKAKLESDKVGYSTFFSAVYVKNAVINSLATATLTASKAATVDKTVTVISSDATNTIKNATIDGVNIGGINLTAVGLVLTIKGTWLASLTLGVHTVIIEMTKGNSVAVTLTITA